MRYLWTILFAVVLGAPFAVRRALLPGGASANPSADAERLVIVTSHNQDIRTEFARAFSQWHQTQYGSNVQLDFRTPGGTTDIKRQLESTYRAYRDANGQISPDMSADISMAWGGGDYFFDQELKPLGILLPIQMPPAMAAEFKSAFPTPTLAGVRLYDSTATADGTPTPQWVGVCLSSFGICFNPDVYRALGMPDPTPQAGWENLTDPRLRGFVALADPAHSGSSAVAYQMVIQHRMFEAEQAFFESAPALRKLPKAGLAKNAQYQAAIAAGWHAGMAELLKIAANARYFTDSSTLVPMDVSRGEAAAGMAIDFYARVTEEAVGSGRIQYFAPVGATAITPDPVAILYGTRGRKLELATQFIQFLLTPAAQRLWDLKPGTPGGPADRSLRRMPIRRDAYADRAGWADDANPFTTANGFNQRGEWMALFGDSRPVWVAAWIDSRDALTAAYAKIVAIPDPARQAALIDRLANLPITMDDVKALRDHRKELEKSHGDLDSWRANQQIDWAAKFRRHYQTVADEAH